MELVERSICVSKEAMTLGESTAVELCAAYLDRIDRIDRSGPMLRSVIEVNPEALSIAASLDRERAERGPRGPLHGIPILIKDNIDTGDRMATTAGSLALEGHIASSDAFIAWRLRQAGAVILGKTNLSEWANFRSTRSSSGWSSRGGQVRNPYALDRSPCGSSSGSGAAAAASLAAAAVGTETDGSIVCPSGVNGLVGIKPTIGLVSRSGIIPIAHSQDTAGPMARTVEDAATLLTTLAGNDSCDAVTENAVGKTTDFRSQLDTNALRGARLGVCRNFFGFHEGVDEVIEGALSQLRVLGAELIDPVDLGQVAVGTPAKRDLLLFEFKAGLNAYLGKHPNGKVGSLQEVIAFNEAHADRVMPYFRQELHELAQAKGDLAERAYLEAKAECLRVSRTDGIDRVLQEHRLDAIVAPTNTPAWTVDLINGDRSLGSCSSPAAMAGYPHITVPAGYVHGLPVGISFFSTAFTEGELIGFAYAFEQATQVRRPPTYKTDGNKMRA
jgi:amidase